MSLIDITKPVSGNPTTQSVRDNFAAAASEINALNSAVTTLQGSVSGFNSHLTNTNNPHAVTKTQIGLGNVDNTSDVNKPISTATQAALDAKQNVLGFTPAISSDLAAHTSNTSNPHSVTKSQIGLGNVDNTSDLNKPISTATQTALNTKQNTLTNSDGLSEGTTNLYFTNSRVISTLLAGLSTATNAVITVSDSILSAFGKLQKQISDNLAALISHTGNTSNPHVVTKNQIGLGNADNTSDANKPISTAAQTALNSKADSSALSAHVVDTGNPHSTTAAQVGAVAKAGDTMTGALTVPGLTVNTTAGAGSTPLTITDSSGSARSLKFHPYDASVEAFLQGSWGTTFRFDHGGFSVTDSGSTGNTLFSFDTNGIHTKKITSSYIGGALYNTLTLTSNYWDVSTVTPAIKLTVYDTAGSTDQLAKVEIFNGNNGDVVMQRSGGNVGIGMTPAQKLDVTGNIKSTGYQRTAPVTVATLTAAATAGAGARHFVTDSTVAASGNFGAAVTGGGSNIVPVYSDGTSWRIG